MGQVGPHQGGGQVLTLTIGGGWPGAGGRMRFLRGPAGESAGLPHEEMIDRAGRQE